MDIAYVVHHYDFAEGTGGYVAELLPRVAREHEVTLYAAGVRAPVPDGVRVVHVPALRGRTYATILSFPLAFRFVRRKHDIVHAQGWVVPEADVVTAHIVLAAWREAAKNARISSPPGERYLGGFVERREANLLRKNTRHAIAPSKKAREEILRRYERTGPISVIPHGFPGVAATPSADVARARLNLPPALTALFIGDTRKGLKVAMQAVAGISNLQLAIVSRSSPAEYLAYARSVGIGDRVFWLGGLDDPTHAYAAADVLLHPTIYDTFGLVVAEAMAVGVPVVVTEHAGISELLSHKGDGWIVRGDPVAGTTEALSELASNASLRQSMGRAAQATAESRDWDTVARETMAVYEQVVAR